MNWHQHCNLMQVMQAMLCESDLFIFRFRLYSINL